jgi:hypothetical protein
MARYAQTMEEHFDTFFIDVGADTLAGLLYHGSIKLASSDEAAQ